MQLNRNHSERDIASAGFTIIEIMISLGITSFVTMSVFALMTMVSKSDEAVDSILVFSNYRAQLATTISSPKNCLKLFGGALTQIVPTTDTPLELYDTGTGAKSVQLVFGPTQNLISNNVQIVSVISKPITGQLMGGNNAKTNYLLSNLQINATILNAGSARRAYGSSQLAENLGVLFELTNAADIVNGPNKIVGCSGQNAGAVQPVTLPVCTPGYTLGFLSPSAGAPPQWGCVTLCGPNPGQAPCP
jgi:type II secretory pathway pseudopilin PulG